ncbi:MAG: helix-turn-helix domain-containing protein [Microlunatus sp.]|nr:helix-turn-helix domain-containing protein [Microlunatus sp.]
MNKAAIYRWLNEGYLPGHKIGNNWRILRDDLQEWMRRGSNIGRRPLPDAADVDPATEVEGQETPDP